MIQIALFSVRVNGYTTGTMQEKLNCARFVLSVRTEALRWMSMKHFIHVGQKKEELIRAGMPIRAGAQSHADSILMKKNNIIS
jgi:hypothetical protein